MGLFAKGQKPLALKVIKFNLGDDVHVFLLHYGFAVSGAAAL